jgi:pSer/pThr/pTyr-binding forkhead associated (FHA) protein
VTLASIAIEEVLLLLKIGFLVLLYLFIWRIVRAASRDLRTAQESVILAPQRPQAPIAPRAPVGRVVVVASPVLQRGRVEALNSAALLIGRAPDNDLALEGDEYASARHARFEPRTDGVWLVDMGSTNGTFVNGVRLAEPRRLSSGDLVRIGETDLRFEP